MSKHKELIERLRCFDYVTCNEAADALEAQAREIEGLRAARQAYASEFPLNNEGEPDVGSIHQNIRAMKAKIESLLKQDDALILQLVEALKQFQYRACESIHPDFVDEAITAGRARLEGNP